MTKEELAQKHREELQLRDTNSSTLQQLEESSRLDAQQRYNQDGPTEMDVIEGPLSELYRNKYASTAIGYPRDIGLTDKGHVVQFDIRDVVPAKIDFEKVISDTKNAAENAFQQFKDNAASEGAVQAAGSAIQSAVGATFESIDKNGAGKIASQLKETYSSTLRGSPKFIPETTSDAVDTIRLYMPDTLSFNYNAQYDKLSLAEAINSVPLVAKVSNAITSVLENKAAKTIANRLGYTFNPQQQMLFEGIDFREFDLQFVFTPTSEQEAMIVKNIIKKLRRAAAPTRNTSAGGFFFTPPSVFEISFFFNGQYNTNIAPIRPCVLQSVNIDYAPNGWAALRDGTPVQTALSLSFKEIELIDRNSIGLEK